MVNLIDNYQSYYSRTSWNYTAVIPNSSAVKNAKKDNRNSCKVRVCSRIVRSNLFM